jgi:CheY-like chemotaxis protein
METILIIEDNAGIRENLTEFFELEGYTILSANNGIKGIEMAEQFVPDLIICDVLMNDMGGYEVFRNLLTSRLTELIPFIFSTSQSEKVDRTEALKMGADDYIIKPFDPELLLKMARKWILSGSQRKSLHTLNI